MSKSDAFEADLLKKIFNATAFPWDAITNLYVSLHTADPGEAGSQTTSEATYVSYTRATVARTSGGWTVSGTAPSQAQNAAKIDFPAATSTVTNTITFFGVGISLSAAGELLYSGSLTSSLIVTPGITPEFDVSQLTVTED